MFVWVMDGLCQACYKTLHHRKESPATLESLMSEVRFENLIPTTTPLADSGQAIAAPLRDDGLPLVLSAVVCLLGHVWALTRVLHDSSSQEGVPCHS